MQKNELDRSMHRYYEQRAPEYDEWYNRQGRYSDPATNAAWHGEVARLARDITHFAQTLPSGPATRLLDLACGTGKWTPFLVRPLAAGARLVAYDYSPAMLDETFARLEDEDPGLLAKTSFLRGDAYRLPFKEGAFDCVFTGFWLSHVPTARLEAFFTEVKRVLKPGGQLLIFDSALMPGKPVEQVQSRVLNDGSRHEVLKIYYTPAALKALLEKFFGEANTGQTRTFFVTGLARKEPYAQ